MSFFTAYKINITTRKYQHNIITMDLTITACSSNVEVNDLTPKCSIFLDLEGYDYFLFFLCGIMAINFCVITCLCKIFLGILYVFPNQDDSFSIFGTITPEKTWIKINHKFIAIFLQRKEIHYWPYYLSAKRFTEKLADDCIG